MIIEKSRKLVELSQLKKTLQKSLDDLQNVQTRQKQITEAVAAIQPLVEVLKAFRQRGITIDLTHKADKLLNFIINIEDEFSSNPDWIFDPENFQGNILKSQVVYLKTQLKEQLSESWKSYRDQKMPSTNNEVLKVLAKLEAFKKTVLQIQIIDRDIKNVTYPKNNAEFEMYELKIEQLNYSWKSLKSDEFPEAVSHFLQAASDQGSPLTLLTPEVQDWINQNGISDSFKIRLI